MEKKKYGYVYASPDRYPLLRKFQLENRQHPTHAEEVLWLQLRLKIHKAKFRRQYIIGDFIVDFVALQQHLIIEVDGAYHGERQQQEDDALRQAWLEKIGFRVLRFTNLQILSTIDKVITEIDNSL